MGRMTKAMESIAEKLVGVDVTELPAVDSGDNGKVLMVVDGQWAAGSLTKELPLVTTTDAGKVLTVSEEGQWAAIAPADGDA